MRKGCKLRRFVQKVTQMKILEPLKIMTAAMQKRTTVSLT